MKKKSILAGICIGTLSLSILCVTFTSLNNANPSIFNLDAQEDLYNLSLDGSHPHNGATKFDATTKSGNSLSFYGENISAGALNDYFMSISAVNHGYFGNGRSSDSQYENALSNLEYICVTFASDSDKAVGSLTLTAGVDASHLFERHYLNSGVGVLLNTPANYFRISAEKTYSDDANNILIQTIELRYSNTCGTGEYATTYGLLPASQNMHCNLQILQLDFSAYSDVLTNGNFTPETVDVIKYTPVGGQTRSLNGKSNDFAYLNTMNYLDFNSGWLSSQTTGKGFGGYSLFDDGDVLTIEGNFVGTSANNMGQKFYVPKCHFIFKNVEGTNYIYNYLPVKSINTGTAIWWQNKGLQFYSDDNFLMESNDITNVGKLKPYNSDSIVLKRNGYPFSIGKANEGWYCLNKYAKNGGTLYQLEFYQSSINFGDAGDIVNNDTIILDGLFIANTYDLLYVGGCSAKYKYDGSAWEIEQVTANKDNDVVEERLKIGFWNGNCHFSEVSKLETIAATGINVIVGVNPIWNSNWNTILNRAQELGVQFIVDPRPYDSGIGSYTAWDGTCPSYANHPAILGFFMYDEPNSTQFSNIESVRQQFKATMPSDKIFFANLFSGACGLESLYGPGSYTESQAFDYEDRYVGGYANAVEADMYGFDTYALFTDGYIRKSYFCDFDVWAYRSKIDELPLWYSLLASGHNSGDSKVYVTPNQDTVRWQMAIGLTYGADGLLGYLYAHNDDGNYHAMADNSGDIIDQTLYDNYSTVVQEYTNWDIDYKNYIWQGTSSYDTGNTNMMFQNLKHNINLSNYSTSVTSNQDLLVGVFNHKFTNKIAYMITNAGNAPENGYYSRIRYNYNIPFSYSAATVTITFGDTYKGVYVYNRGIRSYHEINSNSYSLTIQGMDGAFVVPTNE